MYRNFALPDPPPRMLAFATALKFKQPLRNRLKTPAGPKAASFPGIFRLFLGTEPPAMHPKMSLVCPKNLNLSGSPGVFRRFLTVWPYAPLRCNLQEGTSTGRIWPDRTSTNRIWSDRIWSDRRKQSLPPVRQACRVGQPMQIPRSRFVRPR